MTRHIAPDPSVFVHVRRGESTRTIERSKLERLAREKPSFAGVHAVGIDGVDERGHKRARIVRGAKP